MTGNNNNKWNWNKKQEQIQEQVSAYQRKTVHDIFDTTMSYFEKYIEITGYYPDWENRKQISNNIITRKDIIGNPEKAEKGFSTTLFGLKQALDEKPSFLRDELKEEIYQWISATGIDDNNCHHERIKHLLYGFHEVVEGRGEKIVKEMLNRKETLDLNAPDYEERLNKFFAAVQVPMANEREQESLLKGKTHKDIEIARKFSGDREEGEKVFGRIAGTVSSSHDQFHFFKQKEEAQKQGKVLTDRIKQNMNEWDLKEVVVYKGYYNGVGEKKELALVHKEANLKKYNWQGHLEVDSRMIYFKKDHQPEEWIQIERFYSKRDDANNSQQRTNSEIIQDVKNNPQNWRLDEIITEYDKLGNTKEEKVLIHQNALLDDYDQRTGKLNFDGNPIYQGNRFSPEEIKEINQVLNVSQSSNSPTVSSTNQEIRQDIVNDIRQSGFKQVSVNFGNNYYEDWLVRDSLKVGSSITFDSKNMYKVKDLTEAEKRAIGYKSEVGLQTNFSTTPKNDDNIGKGGILAVIGVVSVLTIGSLVVMKKQLKKSKK